METTNPTGRTNPYLLATVLLTRVVDVCDDCGCLVGDCDHDNAEIVSCRLWRPAVALGRSPVSADDLTPAMVEAVRAACLEGGEVASTATRREVLDACELATCPVCVAARRLVAEVYNALVRSGAVS